MNNQGVLITTYFSLNDALIQAYTLPYVRFIRKYIPSESPVYLVTIDKISSTEEVKLRDTEIEKLKTEGIIVISLTYHPFGISLLRWIPALIQLVKIARSSSIRTIHSWCTPGGIFGYLLSIFSGKKLILDSFEPHAEVMSETGTWKRNSLKFKILFGLEKAMARRSEIQICCTSDMQDYALKTYGKTITNPFIKPAGVDLQIFNFSKKKNEKLLDKLGLKDKIVCVYAGKFGGLYLKQEVFDFLTVAHAHWGDKFRALLLTSESSDNIQKMSRISGLPSECVIHQFVKHSEVADYLGLGDFALAPYQPVPSRKYAAPIKVSEYMAMGLPIVITPNIADDSTIIHKNKLGATLNTLDKDGYCSVILEIDSLLKSNYNNSVSNSMRMYAEKYRGYEAAEYIYRDIYLKN